jgi:hypothetical protein
MSQLAHAHRPIARPATCGHLLSCRDASLGHLNQRSALRGIQSARGAMWLTIDVAAMTRRC